MPLPIVRYNNPILRQKGAKIAVFDAALARLAKDMIETMHAAEGIGLAAQQIGQALQFFVVDLSAGDWEYDWELDGAKPPPEIFMPFAVANAQISPLPGARPDVHEEGCLSFPDIRGDVIRPDAIAVTYQDQFGTPHTLRCNGMLARCIQHEYDHVQGTLFIDRMEKPVRQKLDPAIRALAKRTREAAASA